MAKVRQPYEEPRFVPWLGRDVNPGQVVEVPDADLASYLEAGWLAADKATEREAKRLRGEGVVTVGAVPVDEPEHARDEPVNEPAEQTED